MKKLYMVASIVLISNIVLVQANSVSFVNQTNKWVRVKLAVKEKSEAYHIALNPGQTKVLLTGSRLIDWISAYTYPTASYASQEKTICEMQKSCSTMLTGTLIIRPNGVTCQRTPSFSPALIFTDGNDF